VCEWMETATGDDRLHIIELAQREMARSSVGAGIEELEGKDQSVVEDYFRQQRLQRFRAWREDLEDFDEVEDCLSDLLALAAVRTGTRMIHSQLILGGALLCWESLMVDSNDSSGMSGHFKYASDFASFFLRRSRLPPEIRSTCDQHLAVSLTGKRGRGMGLEGASEGTVKEDKSSVNRVQQGEQQNWISTMAGQGKNAEFDHVLEQLEGLGHDVRPDSEYHASYPYEIARRTKQMYSAMQPQCQRYTREPEPEISGGETETMEQ
jgi:hypothetical protein